MADRFLNKFRSLFAPGSGGGEAHLAAFGKHPAWDDFIDPPIGLETPRLVEFKRIVYGAIEGNVAGPWHLAGAGELTPEFNHLLVWRSANQTVLCRLWASRDRVGREKYPMALCAQFKNVSLPWILGEMEPKLRDAESTIKAAATSQDVTSAVAASLALLRQAVATGPAPDPAEAVKAQSAEAVAFLAARPEFSPDRRGLLNVLYQIDRHLAAFRPGATVKEKTKLAQWLRVPQCGESPGETALLWIRFLLAQLDRSTDILVIVPLDQAWVDLIVGSPGEDQKVSLFDCVRSTLQRKPMHNSIPFELEPEFIDRANRFLDGKPAPAVVPAPPAPAPVPKAAAATGKKTIIMGGGAVALLLMIGLIAFLIPHGGPPAASQAPLTVVPPPVAVPPAAPPPASPQTTAPTITTLDPGSDKRPQWIGNLTGLLGPADQSLKIVADADAKAGAALADRRDQIEKRIAQVRQLPWNADQRKTIESDMASINDDAGSLMDDINTQVKSAQAILAARAVKEERDRRVAFAAALDDRPSPVHSGSAALSAEWAADLRQGKDAALNTARPLEQIDAQIASSADQISQLDGLPAGPIRPLPADSPWAPAAAKSLIDPLREKAMADAVALLHQNASWSGVAADYDRAREGVSALIDQLSQAEIHLRHGDLPDEGQPTLRQISVSLSAQRVPDAASSIVNELRQLLDIEHVGDRNRLLSIASDSTAGLSLRRLAWELAMKAEASPTPQSLTADGAAANLLETALNDEPRESQVSHGLLQKWQEALSAAPDHATADPILAIFAQIGVDEAEMAPEAHFDVLMYDISRRIGTASDSETRTRIQTFIAAAARISPPADRDASIIAGLNDLLSQPGAAAAAAGPAGHGWTSSASGDRLDFTWQAHRIEFARVDPPASSGLRPYYLATTAVSEGLFSDVVDAAHAWDAMRPYLYDAKTGDSRDGPRVWLWNDAGDGIHLNATWLREDRPEYYPGGQPPDPPVRDDPMDYLSPQAAVFMAGLIGCRLPRAAEWQAAYNACEFNVPLKDWNLRGAAWAAQRDYATNLTDSTNRPAPYPDDGAFLPIGSSAATGMQAVAVAGAAGKLWFLPVNQGGGNVFRDLMGNVASYVWNTTGPLNIDEPMGAEQVKSLADPASGHLFAVIGGSSLSDPTIKRDVPADTSADLGDPQYRQGFADVGFRLALSIANQPLSERVADYLRRQPYLKD